MLVFWMLLGGAAGVNFMQAVWRLFGWSVGEVSIAVPVGGAVGVLLGGLLGLIRDPRVLALPLLIFAGAAAGAVAGRLPWGAVGEVSGQAIGGLAGACAWVAWLLFERRATRKQGAAANPEDGRAGDQGIPCR